MKSSKNQGHTWSSNKKFDEIIVFNFKDQNLITRVCQIIFNLFRN